MSSPSLKVSRLGVYGIAIIDSHLLLTTKKDGFYKGLLDLPGGGVEFGENAEQTMKREFVEEVGMDFGSMQLFDNVSFVGDMNHVPRPCQFHHLGQLYFVFDVTPIPNVVAEDQFAWYALQDLNEDMLTPFAKIALSLQQRS